MKKFNNHYLKKMKLLLLVPLLLIAALTVVAAGEGTSFHELTNSLMVSGTGCGMIFGSMALVGNIARVSDKYTAGKQIVAKVILIALDQVDDTVPFPTVNASGEIGTIPLKTGEMMHIFNAIDDSLEDSSAGTKGDITTEVTNTFTFILGGHRYQINKFLEDHAGDRFIVIYQMTDRTYWCLGNDLKPMLLKSFTRSNNKESRSTTLTFENTSFEQPHKYIGSIVTVAPVSLAADATSIAFTAAQQYITSDENTASTTIATFSGLSASDAGRTVEVLGGGGTYPSTIAETDGIILRGGETWTGKPGSSIIFEVLDASTLVEVSRVQTA